MQQSLTHIPVTTPLHLNLRIQRVRKELREIRREWYIVRDFLSVQENADKKDQIKALRDSLWRLEDMYRGNEAQMRATLN